jgi:lysozyme
MKAAIRITVAALALSGTGLVGIALHEQFRDKAYLPTPNDVPTIGFGSTSDVRPGQTITVERGLILLQKDVTQTEERLRECIGEVPLYQHEWDAYVSWAFNVGTGAACSSTLVKLLKEHRYEEACNQLPRWNKQAGRELPGLTKRREKERQLCLHGY